MNFNYLQICQSLLKDLTDRQKEVILRRFGLDYNPPTAQQGKRETLESIGKSYGICRERVRQIEEDGLLRLKPKLKQYQKTFQYFRDFLRASGDLKKEDILLSQLGKEKFQNQVYFLLTLAEPFERFSENKDFYSFWTINQNSLKQAKEIIEFLFQKLQKLRKPLSLKELSSFPPATLTPPSKEQALLSYLEISKKIQQNSEGLFGLKDWPEINPRGVKDRAYLVFKKTQRPLHFMEVANLIETTTPPPPSRKRASSALPQTVHNELIKDQRFVLVGRGIYALAEWGYYPGEVKEVISRVLKEEGKPLTKEEILEKVLKQRLVKENTILLNLSNKKYFLRNPQGKYTLREI